MEHHCSSDDSGNRAGPSVLDRPLRFLHLTTFYPPYSFGGDAIYLYRLCHALADAGHQVDVVHCLDSYHLQHPGEPEGRFTDHEGVRRIGLQSGFGWLSPFLTQQTGRAFLKAAQVRKIMNESPYDVVHYHNISLLGPGILQMQPDAGGPVKLYTTHEHWLVCPMHVLWKFNDRPCESPDCLRCQLRGGRPPQWWRYTNYLKEAAQHVDRFVSPSRFTARMHAERGFPAPVGHLPYFVDRSDNDWQDPAPRPHEKPYFLFVGRLEPIKGLQTLIELWQKHRPEYDLLVAGSGTHESALRKQADSHPNIHFLGHCPQRELGPLYYHAVACIVPSITYETFGIVTIEAFARKTPVIVRELGALPEAVADSGGGFVYRDDNELLRAMTLMAESPSLRRELGGKGYDGFLRWWCREAHLKMYDELLLELMQGRNGQRLAETSFATS